MKQTVLHIEAGRHLYGGAKQVTYLLNNLNNKRFRNVLACPTGSDISKSLLPNTIVEPIEMAGDVDFLLVGRLSKLIQKHRIDLVHVHSRRGADIWGGLAAKLNKVPAILTRRVDNVEGKLARFKYNNYSAVVSISQGVFNVVKAHTHEGHLTPIIHSAVDFEPYDVMPDKAWLADKFEIPNNNYVIANFAQLIQRKGQQDIINAMKVLNERDSNISCLLFGKGKEKDNYQKMIDEMNLNHCVRLCGFSEDVPRILASVDAVVHPAHAEGLGVILLQASASSKPIVASDAGGIPEIVQHNKTGLVVKPGNIDGLVSAISTLRNDVDLGKQLGKSAYRHALKHFGIQTMATSYETLYASLLHN